MAIIAKLYANGRVYKVLRSKQGIKQCSDETGRPTSRPFHTGLLVVIEATQDTSFFEKAIHPTQKTQEIILEYTSHVSGGRTRSIRFVDCYVTLDHTEFKANGREPLTETILITAAGIEDSHSQGKYTTSRRETAFLSEEIPVMVREEQENLIIESGHFEDEKGNKIDEKYNGKAFLVLKTKNGSGKTVDINLSNKKHDFRYNGKILEDDLFPDIPIRGDITKIELEIIEEQNS
ncbi:hypothetical protein ATE84_3813 [Aquimarina sp. MAR_2010_214]|uniref:type VI secretion system tube protein TssD n=1 Tax=Aquimarina sp. MAR_2010_214 TaxID=1250026 RepID=UPI000C707F85|nr:type VI secretion system tube protein TssD [Aquimarina sp. MAR_2010_214]PKV51715.1 hypothetical protein ATE84_3813 [Aquimarina sp. MAR_2010_214]